MTDRKALLELGDNSSLPKTAGPQVQNAAPKAANHTPTLQQARKALVDGLIIALRERPDTFSTTEYWLIDGVTGHRWWISNGYWFFSFREKDIFSPEMKLGGWNRTRGWWAFCRWSATHRVRVRLEDASKYAAHAEALWRANTKEKNGE